MLVAKSFNNDFDKNSLEKIFRSTKFKRNRKLRASATLQSVDTEIQKRQEQEEHLWFNDRKNELFKDCPYAQLTKKCIEESNLPATIKTGLELFLYRATYRPEDKLVNTIATVDLPTPFNVDSFLDMLQKSGLNYRRYVKFSGIPIRVQEKDYKFTISFFKSGKINVAGLPYTTGAPIQAAVKVLRSFSFLLEGENAEFLKKLSVENLGIRNRVYSIKIPALASLDKLELFNSLEWRHVKYNDQAFPGGVYIPFLRRSKEFPLHVEKQEVHPLLQKFRQESLKGSKQKNPKVIFFRTGSCIMVGITDQRVLAVTVCKFTLLMIKYHHSMIEYQSSHKCVRKRDPKEFAPKFHGF